MPIEKPFQNILERLFYYGGAFNQPAFRQWAKTRASST
ncbi:hypothetical protein PAMC26510_12125 [Caballeronia sordidicola]|uniref:Uncharacterized protein n=1 Tax=Caballeronia sordidicola TaxID=196367 RepID=A0A242MYV0_CABSO|nr:hypothetical protein PAMC26510_12125 [Caballeronia sordidicola]